MSKKPDKPDRDAESRQIIPVAEDQEMFFWLESLFQISEKENEVADRRTSVPVPKAEPDNFPERIVLRPQFGRKDLGKALSTKQWRPMQDRAPSREDLVSLANELLAKAQTDCNVNQRRQRYMLLAYSSLKGADAYDRYPFTLTPTGKEYGEPGGPSAPASDDEDTHRDRLLETSLAHNRWLTEQYMEASSGMMKLQNELIRQQAHTIAQHDAAQRAWFVERERLETLRQEREERAEMSKLKREAIGWGMGQIQSLLPAVKIYLSKGQVGIVDGLRNFMETLSADQKDALFGKWEEDAAGRLQRCTSVGVFDEDQVRLFGAIIDGSVDPKRAADLILGMRQDQMQRAQQLLRMEQLQMLGSIAKAVTDIVARENAAAAAQAGS